MNSGGKSLFLPEHVFEPRVMPVTVAMVRERARLHALEKSKLFDKYGNTFMNTINNAILIACERGEGYCDVDVGDATIDELTVLYAGFRISPGGKRGRFRFFW